MQTFDFVKQSDVEETFRVARIASDFDLKTEKITETFKGSITIPKDWSIGVIVGKSGTGKTSIARKLFPEYIANGKYEFNRKSVIDDMPENCTVDEIVKMFYAVGFGSVPNWLKPYNVLSNGEKMRVELARALLDGKGKTIVFDEFTSVVDREVAFAVCTALKKNISRIGVKFIAVTCHYDVLEWLQPDWVFNTDTMSDFFPSAHAPHGISMSGSVGMRNGQSLGVITI